MERFWDPLKGALKDETMGHIVQRKDDIEYVRTLIASGNLYQHDRINTPQKLATFLAELNGPSLADALSMNMRELSKRNVNLSAVPLTVDEHQMQQLDAAIAMFEMMIPPQQQEEQQQAPPPPPQEDVTSTTVWPMRDCVASCPERYTWYRTVWYRVNFAPLFVANANVKSFVDAHLQLVQYLDSLDDPCDERIDTEHMQYAPLRGAPIFSHSERTVTWHTLHDPLQWLHQHFPQHYWTVEEVVHHVMVDDNLVYDTYLDDGRWAPIHPQNAPLEHFRIYYACIYLANQCKTFIAQHAQERESCHFLWTFYAGLVDFFSYAASVPHEEVSDRVLLTPVGSTVMRSGQMQYTDALTPWEMHGAHVHVRAKHAGDLPDLFHVLHSIPLGGEQCTPPTRVGKIYQKSLPSACQQRHIITLITNTIRSDDAFWMLCSRLFWVMLAGLYPGDDTTQLTMRDLMRAKQLTSDKELFIGMLSSISSSDDNDEDGAPLVVRTAFRMHIIYMASFSNVYMETANECLDWERFVENTRHSAELIRTSDLLPAVDPLARARTLLVKTVKTPSARVGRIRRRSLAVTLTERTNEILEKIIIKDYHRRRLSSIPTELSEMDSHFKALRFYEHVLSPKCKSAIVNVLLRLPPEDRFTYKAFSLLTLPEYGGVSIETAERMYDLTRVYYTSSGMPKDFERVLDQFETRHFVIACFYLNVATQLEGIQFVPLDAETVRRTDEAMVRVRYHLFPGQTLPSNAYTVHIALCCGRVCTLMGQGKYGAKTVAFDMEKQCFVCSRGKLLHAKNKLGADNIEENGDESDKDEDQMQDLLAAQNDHIEPVENLLLQGIDLVADALKKNGRGTKRSKEMEARKAVRTERKRFNRIPCGQPVLTVDLRGRALVWGTTREKQRQYMFCPQCGAFHIYSILNFTGAIDGNYRCNECAGRETGHKAPKTCAYCKCVAPNEDHALPIMTLAHPRDGGGGEEWMYFCRNHYNIARRFHQKCSSKEMLWSIIQRVEHKHMMSHVK